MPEVLKLDGWTAKIESSYGTDAAPAAATDGVRRTPASRVWPSITISSAFPNLREGAVTGTLLPASPAPPSGRIVQLEIPWEGRGEGAEYDDSPEVVPEVDPLLRACGMARAFTTPGGPSSSLDYTFTSGTHESCTIYGYAAGNLYRVVGCRGAWRWPVTAGEPGMLVFSMQGIMLTNPATTALPTIGYTVELPPPAVSMALSIGGVWSPEFLTSEFQSGARVERLDSGNAAEGVVQFAIAEFNPRFRLAAKTVALATYNPYTDVRNRTARTIAHTLGSVALNRLKLDVTNAFLLQEPGHEDQSGFAGWALEYQCNDPVLTFD